MRIEDTDQKRLVEGAEEEVYEALRWLGISWTGTPVRQSERLSIYQKYAEQLIAEGNAYHCFCSEERLAKMREEQQASGEITKYDGLCRNLSEKETVERLNRGETSVIRLKVPKTGKISFDDMIRGEIEFDLVEVEDQILMKSDSFPTYQLASVIDDHEQKITHVLRGEEWISSTPKNLLLYRFFSWGPPKFGHLPNIVGRDKKKLSKREGDVAVMDFRQKGYLPEAVVNFLVFLGWNPGGEEEFFTLESLAKIFDIKKAHKSPAVFDLDKLNFFNARYIRHKNIDELLELAESFSKINFDEYEKDYLKKVILTVKDRMVTLGDFDALAKCFFSTPRLEKEMIKFGKSVWEDTEKGLKKSFEKLESIPEKSWVNQGMLNDALANSVAESGLKNGDIFWPVRYALSGEEKSPSPAELLWVIGREESLKRIKKAQDKITPDNK